ncbi:MAG: 2Fe-2S iron-sulfur cluster-binding protein [Imperialibacter sp.]|uniref:2Fe-2S iron-sulfur cluster-binding protein n=1 Tax=Imperialibacter sp. TaxID=2038411 RepID=UPI0032ED37D6
MELIKFKVEDRAGEVQEIEVPGDMGLNLMEVLKASEYPVLGTCGGMALCASCHVSVEEGLDQLDEQRDAELDMLDTLPNALPNSRLACQLPINEKLVGAYVKLQEVME